MYQLTEESLARFEQRMRGIDATLDAKLTQNETRMERLRETVEKILRELRAEKRAKVGRNAPYRG